MRSVTSAMIHGSAVSLIASGSQSSRIALRMASASTKSTTVCASAQYVSAAAYCSVIVPSGESLSANRLPSALDNGARSARVDGVWIEGPLPAELCNDRSEVVDPDCGRGAESIEKSVAGSRRHRDLCHEPLLSVAAPSWDDFAMSELEVKRLVRGDAAAAGVMFEMMARVFGEDSEPLGEDYLDDLLGREGFWALAAFIGPDIVAGLTAHTLPMTRSPSSEVFIYDLAVRQDHWRQGVASRLVFELRATAALAGIHEIFVAADNEDVDALDFYRALGATASPVTFFTFKCGNA